MTREEWRDVAGFEGFYQVSNLGRVRSVEHIDVISHLHPSRIIKQRQERTGYMRVHFSKNGVSSFQLVHRLVATAFVQQEDGCNIVNHINSDRTDNRALNLEWTTHKGNMIWASKQGHMRGKPDNFAIAQKNRRVPVYAIDSEGNRQLFESQIEAARALNISRSHIGSCCRGEYGYQTIRGFRFEFAK